MLDLAINSINFVKLVSYYLNNKEKIATKMANSFNINSKKAIVNKVKSMVIITITIITITTIIIKSMIMSYWIIDIYLIIIVDIKPYLKIIINRLNQFNINKKLHIIIKYQYFSA